MCLQAAKEHGNPYLRVLVVNKVSEGRGINWGALLRKRERSLQTIIDSDPRCPSPLVKGLLDARDNLLFVARQKEGKSTLALQLAIDVSCGDPFLDHYETRRVPVLYVDYENRFYRLNQRGRDLAQGRRVDNLIIQAYDYLSERHVGLHGESLVCLKRRIAEHEPELLILDPLRYAWVGESVDERDATKLIEILSSLRKDQPDMAIVLVHHLRKGPPDGRSPRLRDDPRNWIEKTYGSQALLAHVDTIWGLEVEGDDGYTFATVPRANDPLMLRLEKRPESERFLLGSSDVLIFKTQKQWEEWDKLPAEFGWRQAIEMGFSNNLLNAIIRQARAAGRLVQDSKTKRYRKVDSATDETQQT